MAEPTTSTSEGGTEAPGTVQATLGANRTTSMCCPICGEGVVPADHEDRHSDYQVGTLVRVQYQGWACERCKTTFTYEELVPA